MKFGKVEDKKLLDAIDFTLPPEPQESIDFRATLPKNSEMKIYIGAPRWAVKEWVGKIYPEKTKMEEYLKYYSQSFNSIELNTTHYQVPEVSKIVGWMQQIPDSFMFSPKFSQRISHYGGLVNEQLVTEFVQRVENFGPNLGVSFIQMSERFPASRIGDIVKFLSFIPQNFKLGLEIRHESWFKDQKIFELMRKNKVASIISDVSGRRDVLHMNITSDTVIIRFTGNNLHPTDYKRVDEWVKKIKEWSESGIKELYFFVHEPDDVSCPELSDYLIKKLQENGLKTSASMHFYQPEEISLGL